MAGQKNFPERLNQRRKDALDRLSDKSSTTAAILRDRIMPSARHIKTLGPQRKKTI